MWFQPCGNSLGKAISVSAWLRTKPPYRPNLMSLVWRKSSDLHKALTPTLLNTFGMNCQRAQIPTDMLQNLVESLHRRVEADTRSWDGFGRGVGGGNSILRPMALEWMSNLLILELWSVVYKLYIIIISNGSWIFERDHNARSFLKLTVLFSSFWIARELI